METGYLIRYFYNIVWNLFNYLRIDSILNVFNLVVTPANLSISPIFPSGVKKVLTNTSSLVSFRPQVEPFKLATKTETLERTKLVLQYISDLVTFGAELSLGLDLIGHERKLFEKILVYTCNTLAIVDSADVFNMQNEVVERRYYAKFKYSGIFKRICATMALTEVLLPEYRRKFDKFSSTCVLFTFTQHWATSNV